MVPHSSGKPDVYLLYLKVIDGSTGQPSFIKYDLATVTNLANSLKLQTIFKERTLKVENHMLSGLYFQCEYVKRFKRWEPIELLT